MNIPVNKNTLLRLIALTVGAFALAVGVPVPKMPVGHGPEMAAAAFVGGVLAFLIFQAASRRYELFSSIFIELNKLRRVYHLSKNLAEASPRFRIWFTDLHGYLVGYLNSFAGKDLARYRESNVDFRRLSYHIYTIPEVETHKETALFDELLRTTAVVAESRQRVKEALRSRLSPYSWIIVLLMAAGFVITVVATMVDTVSARLAGGALVAAVVLAVDLLWELDTMGSDMEPWAKRYVNNVSKLELGRRD